MQSTLMVDLLLDRLTVKVIGCQAYYTQAQLLAGFAFYKGNQGAVFFE